MLYRKYKPAKSLEKFVECYFTWEGEFKVGTTIESPPNALCSLVFNFKDGYSISNYKYKNRPVPHCFITGQALTNYTLHLKGKIGIAGIVFKPATIFHLFGMPMYEMVNERICFSEICAKSCKNLTKKLQETSNNRDKIIVLEKYIIDALKHSYYGTPEIIKSANAIFNNKGQINITEVLDNVPMSRRNFERKFLSEVGVSPKTYAKIRRFGYTCSLMAGNRDINLMDVLCQGGYYDQSHFIKDFKYFSGRTPRIYSKTNVELANYIDGITSVELKLQQGVN